VRITDKVTGDIHYRVGGAWAGSYLYGRSWKLNSSIISYSFSNTTGNCPKKTVDFLGTSGSIYSCVLEYEGADWYLESVIYSYIKDLKEEYIQVITLEEFKKEFVPKT
jgi:hypothetical protein